MTGPAAPSEETLSCGPLRREPDGTWFFGDVYLGRDGRPLIDDGAAESRAFVVAARLANGLRDACTELEAWGDRFAAGKARDLLRRFERWVTMGTW